MAATKQPQPTVQELQMAKAFATNGFEAVTGNPPKRLLVGSQGQERTGKTDWALRMPGPIAYIGLDFGHEGVIEKRSKDRKIFKWTCNVPTVSNQSEYLKYWLEVRTKIEWAITKSGCRSIVIDTGSDIWELLRLAEFGALTKSGDVKQLYNQINQAYRSMIRQAYDQEVNMCVLHKVKPLYEKVTVSTPKGPAISESWDGVTYKRAGFGEGGFLIQCQIEHLFDKDRPVPKGEDELAAKFGIRVLDCRQNMAIAGMELWGRENNFATLASYVFDCDEKDFQ